MPSVRARARMPPPATASPPPRSGFYFFLRGLPFATCRSIFGPNQRRAPVSAGAEPKDEFLARLRACARILPLRGQARRDFP